MTDGQVFAQSQFLEPRIRLAQARLLFAHKILTAWACFCPTYPAYGVAVYAAILDQRAFL